MKPKLTIGVSILISLLLVAFGLLYGNVSGYADERAHVTALLAGESGLTAVLGYRAADGLNLCVVADRHIPGDADATALRSAANALRSGETSLTALKLKDGNLSTAFSTLATRLAATPSLTASQRDRQYLSMLTADFAQCGENAIFATYNKAAADFNQKLQTPVLGDVARFFGVKPSELYE